MPLAKRRSLYSLLRLRASPSVKLAVEGSMAMLTGVELVESGRLLSEISSKTLLLHLSRLLESINHPFDGSQLCVCIVDFLATMGFSGSQHDVLVPKVMEDAPFSIEGSYDVIVIHGMDVLPRTVEDSWIELLEEFVTKTGIISIFVDAVYHSHIGKKWVKADRKIRILKKPARMQNLLRL